MSLRVLHIDDDFEEREIFSEALLIVDPTVSVRGAYSGANAFSMLENENLPDLIFLDINMPLMNGFEVLQLIKNSPRLEKIPVILLSTSFSEHDIKRGFHLGATRYIVKPNDLHTLAQSLKILLQPKHH